MTSLDDELDSWELFHQILRKENADLFRHMFDDIKEYRKAIESQSHRPTEALLMAIILKNQKRIEELKKEQSGQVL